MYIRKRKHKVNWHSIIEFIIWTLAWGAVCAIMAWAFITMLIQYMEQENGMNDYTILIILIIAIGFYIMGYIEGKKDK